MRRRLSTAFDRTYQDLSAGSCRSNLAGLNPAVDCSALRVFRQVEVVQRLEAARIPARGARPINELPGFPRHRNRK